MFVHSLFTTSALSLSDNNYRQFWSLASACVHYNARTALLSRSLSLSTFLCFSLPQPFLLPDKPLVACFVVAVLLLVVAAQAISKFLALISDSFRLPSPHPSLSLYLWGTWKTSTKLNSLDVRAVFLCLSSTCYLYLRLSFPALLSLSPSIYLCLSISFSFSILFSLSISLSFLSLRLSCT